MALRNGPRPLSRSGGRTSRVTAVEVGYSAVRVVEVDHGPSGPRLLKHGSAPLPPGCLDDASAIRAHLASAIKAAYALAGIAGGKAVASVPRRMVTLKYARLPHATPEQVAGMVQFEAQQYIPFPIEDVVLDHEIVSDPGDDLTSVMIVAARRSLIEEVMAAFDSAGVDVTRLSVSSLAIAEFGRDSLAPTALLGVEPGAMDMAIVSDGRMVFSRAAVLPEPLSGVTDPSALADEVIRSFAAYENEHRGRPVGAVRITGSQDAMAAVESSLAEALGNETVRLNGSLIPSDGPDSGVYSGAIGLALSEDGRGLSRIDLVPASRAERKLAARRRIQGVGLVIAAAGAVAAAIYWGSVSLTEQRQQHARTVQQNYRLKAVSQDLSRDKAAYDRVAKAYQTAAAGLDRSRPAIDVIKAVSDAVPKQSVYLTQLAMDRAGTVTVHGSAASESAATDMVLALQKSHLLTEVRLGYLGDAAVEAGPTTANPTAGLAKPKPGQKMSFTITCKIPPIAGRDEALSTNRPGVPASTPAGPPGI